ncbi:uncharacterized protein PAC_03492 [Phialocephala subalpina]|uniref:Uncharacterized protein n=1 Tax=Phialocephala subalpina TaxID=576137 RepID=A0A1L7WLG1_9HELO|nr:uncharacterized protein PAC_03492 [Phialocephala subalpina]
MTDSNEFQPSQKSLEDIKEIDKTLQELGKWLQRAKFEPGKTEKTENCAENMLAAAKPLLDALGFKGPKRYNVLRIHGPNTTRIRNVDIVPIQVWGLDLMLDGKELKPKTIIHITKGVDIEVAKGSISDLLIIAD